MSFAGQPTHHQLAWGLVEVFDELTVERVNEMLAKNVPMETLEFFAAYAEQFAAEQELDPGAARRVPNLLLLGYLLRVVEERVLGDDGEE